MTARPPLTMRESSKQDTSETTGEMAVQDRPSRSILKRLRVERVQPSIVRPLMVKHHYLHSMPAALRRCYGVSLDGGRVAAVKATFARSARCTCPR